MDCNLGLLSYCSWPAPRTALVFRGFPNVAVERSLGLVFALFGNVTSSAHRSHH